MHAMWKPQKFKYIYLYATLYVFTLTLPSAVAVYWAFGDKLLDHSNAFSLLPRSGWRDAGVILMLIHQVQQFFPPLRTANFLKTQIIHTTFYTTIYFFCLYLSITSFSTTYTSLS